MIKLIAPFSFIIGFILSPIILTFIFIFYSNFDPQILIRILATIVSSIAVSLAIWVHIKNIFWKRDDQKFAYSEIHYNEGKLLLEDFEKSFDKELLTKYDFDTILHAISLIDIIKEKLTYDIHQELFEEKIKLIKSKFDNKISTSKINYLFGFDMEVKILKGDEKFLSLHSEILKSLHLKYKMTKGEIFDCGMFERPIEFISGLQQAHIITILSFLYGIDEKIINKKLNSKKYNDSKWIRRQLPYLTSAYFFTKEVCKENR